MGLDSFQWLRVVFSGPGCVSICLNGSQKVWKGFSGSGWVSVALERFLLVLTGFSGSRHISFGLDWFQWVRIRGGQ